MPLIIAPQPQPKILSVVTVPTGGWQLRSKISVSTSLDTTVDVTIPAGDYFVAWDQQADDFINALTLVWEAGIYTGSGNTYPDAVHIYIDTTHKVNIRFSDTNGWMDTATKRDVQIDWTALDGPSIAGVLGFDSSAADTSTGTNSPLFTADYQHAYGWYAGYDGAISEDLPHDISEFKGTQVFTLSGQSKVQKLALQYHNTLGLQYVPEIKMWSDDVGYTVAPVYPYAHNEPLECWWKEAHQGKRFRVYRDGQIDTTRFAFTGLADISSGTSTTLVDADISWPIDPDRWTGRLLYMPDHFSNAGDVFDVPQRWYIESNTATVLTINEETSSARVRKPGYWSSGDGRYYLMEQTYGTYVLDVEQMSRFEPTEHPHINEYSLKIPLRKYVA